MNFSLRHFFIPFSVGVLAGLAAAAMVIMRLKQLDPVPINSSASNTSVWLWMSATVFCIIAGLVSILGMIVSAILCGLFRAKSKTEIHPS